MCTDESAKLTADGLSKDVAKVFCLLSYLNDFLPISNLMAQHEHDIFSAARTYREVRQIIGISSVMSGLSTMQLHDHWDRMAQQTLVSRFQGLFLKLVHHDCGVGACNPENYFSSRRGEFKKWQSLHDELHLATPTNLNPYMVMADALESILEKSED